MWLLISYIALYVAFPLACYLFFAKRRRAAGEDTPETEPDYGGEIATTFRTLARKLKGAGEYPLCADALFLASKAEGGELPLYAAAYALQLIAEETTQGEAVRTAAAELYELNEGAGE
jgi:hypothetical protein